MSRQAIRPFDEILRTINNGQLIDDLTDEMTKVISAIRTTGKAGKISVTLNLYPRGSDNTQMEVRPSIKGTVPETERRISLFYVNSDDGLQRDDPLQHFLPGIQPVDAETGEVISK